jgi:hypothetical protein
MPRAMAKTAAKSATMWLAWTMTGDGAGITGRIGTITITIWEFISATTMMTTARVTMMTTVTKASRGRGRLDSAHLFSPQQSLNQAEETNYGFSETCMRYLIFLISASYSVNLRSLGFTVDSDFPAGRLG